MLLRGPGTGCRCLHRTSGERLCHIERDIDTDRGAAAEGGGDFEIAAGKTGALLHADKAEAVAGELGFEIEALAEVEDFEMEAGGCAFEQDLYVGFAGVLDDIAKGFLGDAIKGGDGGLRGELWNVEADKGDGHELSFAELSRRESGGRR